MVADVRARISQSLYEKYLEKPYEFHLNHNSATLVNNLFQLTAQFTNGFILQGMMLVTNVITIFAKIASRLSNALPKMTFKKRAMDQDRSKFI